MLIDGVSSCLYFKFKKAGRGAEAESAFCATSKCRSYSSPQLCIMYSNFQKKYIFFELLSLFLGIFMVLKLRVCRMPLGLMRGEKENRQCSDFFIHLRWF